MKAFITRHIVAPPGRTTTFCGLLALLIGCGVVTGGGEEKSLGSSQAALTGLMPITGAWAAPIATPVTTTAASVATPPPSQAIIPPAVGSTYQGIAADGTYHQWLADAVSVSTAVSALRGQPDFHAGNGMGAGVYGALMQTALASDNAVTPASITVTDQTGQSTVYSKSADTTRSGSFIYYPPFKKSGNWLEVVSSCQMFLRTPSTRTEFFRQGTAVDYYPKNTWLPKQAVLIRENDGNFDAINAYHSRVLNYHFDASGHLTSVTQQLGWQVGSPEAPFLKISWTTGSEIASVGGAVVKRLEWQDGSYINFAYKKVNGTPILAAMSHPSAAPLSSSSASAVESIMLGYSDLGHFAGYQVTANAVADGVNPVAVSNLPDSNAVDSLVLGLAVRSTTGSTNGRSNGALVQKISARNCMVTNVAWAGDVLTLARSGGASDPILDNKTIRFSGALIQKVNTGSAELNVGQGDTSSYAYTNINGRNVRTSVTTAFGSSTATPDSVYGMFAPTIVTPEGTLTVSVAADVPAPQLHRVTKFQETGGRSRTKLDEILNGERKPIKVTDENGQVEIYTYTSGKYSDASLKRGETAPRQIHRVDYGTNGCDVDEVSAEYDLWNDSANPIVTQTTCGLPATGDPRDVLKVPKAVAADGSPYAFGIEFARKNNQLTLGSLTAGPLVETITDWTFSGTPLASSVGYQGTTRGTRAVKTDEHGTTTYKSWSLLPRSGPQTPSTGNTIFTLENGAGDVGAVDETSNQPQATTRTDRQTLHVQASGVDIDRACILPEVTMPLDTPTPTDAGADASGKDGGGSSTDSGKGGGSDAGPGIGDPCPVDFAIRNLSLWLGAPPDDGPVGKCTTMVQFYDYQVQYAGAQVCLQGTWQYEQSPLSIYRGGNNQGCSSSCDPDGAWPLTACSAVNMDTFTLTDASLLTEPPRDVRLPRGY